MFIILHKKTFFVLTGIFVFLAVCSMFYFGFTAGVDFKGGSIAEIVYPQGRPDKSLVEVKLSEVFEKNYSLRSSGEDGFILRTETLSADEHRDILKGLSLGGEKEIVEERFSSIGPTIGKEARTKALLAVGVVLAVIVIFITFAFRKISNPVSSWKYGLVTILTLFHDILVPSGAYALYGKITGAEIDVLFVMGLLAILGYSVNDTIIIFDRVRENLKKNEEMKSAESFSHAVGRSLSETYGRSINTSLTTLLVLLALFFLGGESTKSFVFLLTLGVIAGTYSSLFLAAPLLTLLEKKSV
ncbi:MAG: protein translocase subunit SecF [bacterium]|nr:protein translocase subunit SecF [bacterium]